LLRCGRSEELPPDGTDTRSTPSPSDPLVGGLPPGREDTDQGFVFRDRVPE
jgi:hypothetical protein